jgi:DNA-directed RNA polymerase specialized sigma24 family protein
MDLFRRFALGEIDAFETLARQFQGDVYAWIVRIVRDPSIAEDLTVATLWRISRARHQRQVKPRPTSRGVHRIIRNIVSQSARCGSFVSNPQSY